MLTWLYDLLMTFVTFIMSFFGVDLKKKNVTFASDMEKEEEKKEKEEEVKPEDIAVPTPVAATE